MRTLYLLRHAQARNGRVGEPDHDRGLSPAGRRDAVAIGKILAQRVPTPALVLCSSARRAVDTLAEVRGFLPDSLEVRCERGLYLAAGEAILDELDASAAAQHAVLVIGHNPGIGQLAADLARSDPGEAAARLQRVFPTAALAQLHFDAERWSDIGPGCARAVEFTLAPSAASTR